MKVSIIIPVYNVAQYIIPCLDSVYNQTYKDFEVILVDDCGIDNSMDIILQYLTPEKLQKTKIIHHNKNKGLSAARNTGIKNATGQYILFLDSDDSISLNALNLMVNLAETNNLQLVIGENYIINKTEKKYINIKFKENIITNNTTAFNYYISNKWYNTAWNKLLQTKFIINNALYFKEGFIYEDELWSFMLATKVERIGVIREPLYNYFIRPNSIMTSNQKSRRWFGLLKILPFIKEHIFHEKLSENLKVNKFFLFKLIVSLNGLKAYNNINYKIYKQIKELNYVNIKDLYKNKHISPKEYLCYLHLSLPSALGYIYYKCTELYYKYR